MHRGTPGDPGWPFGLRGGNKALLPLLSCLLLPTWFQLLLGAATAVPPLLAASLCLPVLLPRHLPLTRAPHPA